MTIITHQQKQMMYTNILVVLLKNDLTHEIMMKEEENKNVIALMKDKKHGKIITKYAAVASEVAKQ